MIIEKGEVVELMDGLAVVVVSRSSACEGCGARGVCHTFGGDKDAKVSVENTIEAKTGDMVEIGIDEASLVTASFIVYIVPVIALLMGAGVGQFVSGYINISEGGGAAFGGLFAMIASLLLIRFLNPVFEKYRSMRPKIIKVV
jgi:sigma-E factor negative regulatory protein RseC